MWGDEDCSLSRTKGGDSLDLVRHSKMFRPSCRSSGPFSLMDLDMWDTKSRFSAQTSAWCGMATVSGSGFLSKVSTSTSGGPTGCRQNDPGLRKWQSSSHLAPEGAAWMFPPSPRAELQAALGESCFRKDDMVQWLQDAHEHTDTKLDRLRARDAQLSYNITTAQLFDMKHKWNTASFFHPVLTQQLSEAMSTLEQEKEAAVLSRFDKNQQHRELHEKILKLEKDLLQMRSTLDSGDNDQPTERTPRSLSRTLPESQEDFNRQDKVDKELCKLREALREAETRAKTQEEERSQALLQLQTSYETQRRLLSQIEEMNQRLSHTIANHSEVQDHLSEANNKVSRACLEKAILSTQVLKLEDNVKELKVKLTAALSDKDHLIQEKADLHKRAQVLELHLEGTQPGSEDCVTHDHLANAESHSSKQDQETVLVNEKLTCEHEMIKQKLEKSQSQLQELIAERVVNINQIRDLETERAELIRQKEKLQSEIKERGVEMKEKCGQLRESVKGLELEKQKLQDHCLCLEAEAIKNEEKLHQLEEEYQKRDAMRVQNIEELKALASHWNEKWQKVTLSLRSTQEELEEFKKNNSRIEAGLDVCQKELELERSRGLALPHKYEDKGSEAVLTQDKETMTDLAESSLFWEPPSDSHSSQLKPPQVCIQSSEVQRLKETLAERERELREKEDALKSLERLRESEKTEAQIKVSALELKLMKKAPEDGQNGEGRGYVSTTDSLRTQLEESRRRAKQLQQEKSLAVQKIEALKQLYLVKDEKPPVEGRKDKTACGVNPEAVQQRRMVTEQSLFKEREGKEVGKADKRSAAAKTGTTSPQDWTNTSRVVRGAVNRWSWQQGSGLMPVLEEDEEGSDLPGDEEGEPEGEAHAEKPPHNQGHQMSGISQEISDLKAKNENLPPAVRFKQPIQDLHTAAEKVLDKSSDAEVPIRAHLSDACDLQRSIPSLYPDGIFLAELIDISSPDEDEEEAEAK